MPNNRSGKCLCGGVSFTLALADTKAHVCHCHMCRKSGSGGPTISVDCENVKINGEDNLSWYRSSKSAERGFCKKCGSSLFFRLIDGSSYMNVSTGVLDDESGITIRDHIYVDCKPSYYDFADKCPRFTEAEFLAKIQGESNDATTN